MANLNETWGREALNRADLITKMRTSASQNAEEAIRLGYPGKELLRSVVLKTEDDSDVPEGYLVDQGEGPSSMVIGPIRLRHSVQDISISEEKAVFAPPLVRSDRPLLVDSGLGLHRANITLIFTDLEEINTALRSLVALFKLAPITVIKNEMISTSWGAKTVSLIQEAERIAREIDDEATRDSHLVEFTKNILSSVKYGTLSTAYIKTFENKLNKTPAQKFVYQSFLKLAEQQKSFDYVPVALERLSVQTVPDVPNTIIATLSVTRIDLSSVTESGRIPFLSRTFGPAYYPYQAYWLKKAIKDALQDPYSPIAHYISPEDMGRMEIRFFSKTIRDVRPLDDKPSPIILNVSWQASKVIGQSCTLENRFGYQRLVGKPYPIPNHMGSSARTLSLDFHLDALREDKFKRLKEFVETSDRIVRSESYLDRAMGWEIVSPVSKILGGPQSSTAPTIHGVYVPLHVSTELSDVPGLRAVSMTLQETNTEWKSVNEIVLESGGTDLADMRRFFFGFAPSGGATRFYGILPGEERIRERGSLGYHDALKASDPDARAYSVFWPIGASGSFSIVAMELSSMVNRDTLRAALLSRKFDKGGELRNAMLETPLFSGVSNVSPSTNLFDKINTARKQIGFSTPTLGDQRVNRVVPKLIRALGRAFSLKDNLHDLADAIEEGNTPKTFQILRDKSRSNSINLMEAFLASFAGRPRALDDVIYKLANTTDIEFTKDFKEALFDVIIKRPNRPTGLPHVYDVIGLHSAFEVFYREFTLYRENYPGFKPKVENLRDLNTNWRRTTYRDFTFLPTYKELFGSKWELAAPTFDELGVSYWDERPLHKPIKISLEENQRAVAVLPDDKVPPHIFFYSRRIKPDLYSMVSREESAQNSILGSIDSLYLSLNYTSTKVRKKIDSLSRQTEVLEAIASSPESLNDIINSSRPEGTRIRETIKSLEDIILEGIRNDGVGEYDLAALQEDIEKTQFLGKEDSNTKKFRLYYNKYFSPNRIVDIPIYISVAGHPTGDTQGLSGFVDGKTQLSPLFGAALIRVMHERRWEIKKRVPFSKDDLTPAQDEFLTTVSGPRAIYGRNLKENIAHTVKSSLSQLPDDMFSMARLWPTTKVYFVDRRGDDIVAQDLLTSTDGIISIDITLDKEDAETAVIKIADPMRILQESAPTKKNTIAVRGKYGVENTLVLGEKRNRLEGFLKSLSIVQGRAVVIKMGFDSVADNLHTVFTGRISEVVVGDELVIICQGWKAELINRHVNFYTARTRNWSPKDLAVLAIQQANPDGFGQYFPEFQTLNFMANLDKLSIQDQLHRIEEIKADVSNVYGHTALFAWLWAHEGLANFLDLSDPKTDKGLDTRLKNIWYPDTSVNISNFANFRRILGIHPDFSNDYWLVPLQPCWNVLQEAARHTWHYIVQTVPYDHESTIFFGHPDGLYFYTRGNRRRISNYKKLAKENREEIFENILLPSLKEFLQLYTRIRGSRRSLRGELSISTDPTILARYKDLENILGRDPMSLVYQLLFDIDPAKARIHIQPYSRIQTALLSPEGNEVSDTIVDTIVKNITVPLYKVSPFYLNKIESRPLKELEKDIITRIDDLKDMIRKGAKVGRISHLFFSKHFALVRIIKSSEILSTERILSKLEEANSLVGQYVSEGSQRLNLLDDASKRYSEAKLLILYVLSNLPSPSKLSSLPYFPAFRDIDPSISLGELLVEHRDYIKDFVAFLLLHLQNESNISSTLRVSSAYKPIEDSSISPNLRTFRVFHRADSDRDIICNKIVASTAQMWNTVVINRPDSDPVDTSTAEGAPELYRGATVSSSVSWVYWPPSQISKVIGLQFHPGISLSNKKLRSFTELNCVSAPLSAKLACNRLAEGIRKMYIGQLSLRGRAIKPYDRIILNDKYNNMSGPVEVESVVHHFSPDMGWVTNIAPCAICESNPGASVVQTAVLQSTFQAIMDTADYLMYAVMAISFVASPIGGLAFMASRLGIRGAGALAKGLLTTSIRGAGAAGAGIIKNVLSKKTLAAIQNRLGAITIQTLAKQISGTLTFGKRVLFAYLANLNLNTGAYIAGNLVMANSWVDGNKDPQALPVVLTPLMYNGHPWTAGLEADDMLFSVPFFDTYYSYADFLTWLNDSVERAFDSVDYPR